MYVAGAHIITTYSNKSYASFVRERILNPLNMTSSSYFRSELEWKGIVVSQGWHDGRRIPRPFREQEVDLNGGDGGLISNAEDMAKWLKLQLNQGVDPATNNTIIPRWVFEEITAPHFIMSTGANSERVVGYGAGWWQSSLQGHEVRDCHSLPALVPFLC